MKYLFVPPELALLAKEKGFNEPCLRYYLGLSKHLVINGLDKFHEGQNYNSIATRASAPMYQQLVDWFRENYGMFVSARPTGVSFEPTVNQFVKGHWVVVALAVTEDKYYPALTIALEEAFKLI